MIKPCNNINDADLLETVDVYINKLYAQEKNDRSLFIKRENYLA